MIEVGSALWIWHVKRIAEILDENEEGFAHYFLELRRQSFVEKSAPTVWGEDGSMSQEAWDAAVRAACEYDDSTG